RHSLQSILSRRTRCTPRAACTSSRPNFPLRAPSTSPPFSVRCKSTRRNSSLSGSPQLTRTALSSACGRVARQSSATGLLVDFHDLFFFGRAQVFDLLGFGVGDLFKFFESTLLFVLADLLVFLELVDRFLDVAADVAHRGAVIFEHLVDVLH